MFSKVQTGELQIMVATVEVDLKEVTGSPKEVALEAEGIPDTGLTRQIAVLAFVRLFRRLNWRRKSWLVYV